jgi:hypothetical protein
MAETGINALLERYLGLLDEYTTLQTRLSSLHSGVYQNLAKANFSAERGIRYGQDYYDERMHAARRLAIEGHESSSASEGRKFSIYCDDEDSPSAPAQQETDEAGNADDGTPDADKEDDAEGSKKTQKKRNDPLRWFGILTPLPLRQAQQLAIQSVEEVIPRLATVDAEMASIELEVRRARKKRAKAESAAQKIKQQESQTSGSAQGGIVA